LNAPAGRTIPQLPRRGRPAGDRRTRVDQKPLTFFSRKIRLSNRSECHGGAARAKACCLRPVTCDRLVRCYAPPDIHPQDQRISSRCELGVDRFADEHLQTSVPRLIISRLGSVSATLPSEQPSIGVIELRQEILYFVALCWSGLRATLRAGSTETSALPSTVVQKGASSAMPRSIVLSVMSRFRATCPIGPEGCEAPRVGLKAGYGSMQPQAPWRLSRRSVPRAQKSLQVDQAPDVDPMLISGSIGWIHDLL